MKCEIVHYAVPVNNGWLGVAAGMCMTHQFHFQTDKVTTICPIGLHEQRYHSDQTAATPADEVRAHDKNVG
jgi:hypothetical protein